MSVNVINDAALAAIGSNIETIYEKARDGVEDNLVGKVYNERKTNKSMVAIRSLDGFGLMREFKSERQPGIVGEAITVATPVKWERTIDVKREDIEDDDYGYITDLANSVGVASKRTPIAEIAKALMKGFTTTLSDGQYFFSAAHGNLQSGTLNASNLQAALDKIAAQTDANGGALAFQGKVLVVGPSNTSAAKSLIETETISGTTNIYYKALDLVISPFITDNSWYVVDNAEGVMPLLLVMRVAPDKIVARDETNSDRAFDKDIYSWGTRGRFCAAYHNYKLIVGSTGS